MRYLLRAEFKRLSDNQKFAFLQPVSKEMFNGGAFEDGVVEYLMANMLPEVQRLAISPLVVSDLRIAEEEEVELGDGLTGWRVVAVRELDKNLLAIPQDVV